MSYFRLLLVVALVAPIARSAAQSRLGLRDFVVAKIGEHTDSSAARRILGRPDSVTHQDHPFDVGGQLIDWWYPKLRVSYNGGSEVAGVWILARGIATSRGIQVGDSRTRVQRAYGKPADVDSTSDAWNYRLPGGDDLHLIKVFFRRDRVASLFLGIVLD